MKKKSDEKLINTVIFLISLLVLLLQASLIYGVKALTLAKVQDKYFERNLK